MTIPRLLVRLFPWLLVLFFSLLAGCQASEPTLELTAPSTEVGGTVTASAEVEEPLPLETVQPGTPTPFPTPAPTQAPVPSPTAFLEPRTVELEWPPRMRLGESDLIRLAFYPTGDGYAVAADFPDHQVQSQPVEVDRPPGYSLYGVARLDGVGFAISPEGLQEQYLPEGEAAVWRWTLSPQRSGQQRLSVSLMLRWQPEGGAPLPVRESLVYSRGLDVQVLSFLGMNQTQVMAVGFLGLVLGASLSLMALRTRDRPARSGLAIVQPKDTLEIEVPPGVGINPQERALLQGLFGRYRRLLLEREFFSGYSGARTFLALPVHPDGRADAYTIAKIGDQVAIGREYENYERFVQDTLPPITGRIQHPPVTVSGSHLGALRYTFIGEPGAMPTSLREALLAGGSPDLLFRLFDTFGPNWWMQRRPHAFRLSQEYDRVLPAHYHITPAAGKGRPLDGRLPPPDPYLAAGERVSLHGFSQTERRVDGKSFSLRGERVADQPALRVRWLSPGEQRGAQGEITATRWTLLAETAGRFERYGLPDPLSRVTSLLNENLLGSRAIIHGDLNLENILLGPGDLLWLIDFAQTREGHPLYDFAHLEAEIIAHVIAREVVSPQEYLELLASGHPLLGALHEIAARCLLNPSQPREYDLALFMACLGALKYENLEAGAKHLLYLTSAYVLQRL